jgi:hypothetical protein
MSDHSGLSMTFIVEMAVNRLYEQGLTIELVPQDKAKEASSK